MTSTAFPPAPLGELVELALRGGGVDRSAWPEELLAADLQALQRRRAKDAGEEAEVILALAARRPAAADPIGPGARRPGWAAEAQPEISEFFVAELSALLNLGRGTASYRLKRALTWSRKLPGTLAALKAGRLDERRADALADELAAASPEIARQVEDALLPEAGDLSVYRLRERATTLMLRLDAEAAEERRKEAERTADVHLYPSGVEGRATLAVDLPTDEAAECLDLIDQLARMLKADGDPRPIGALRAHVHSLLIRRPADNGLPLVAADLRITASLDSLTGASPEPGEVNGLPITAAHLQELLARVGALGLTAPDGGTLTYAVTGPGGQLLATMTPAELARLARRGCTDHPDPGSATDTAAVTGSNPGADTNGDTAPSTDSDADPATDTTTATATATPTPTPTATTTTVEAQVEAQVEAEAEADPQAQAEAGSETGTGTGSADSGVDHGVGVDNGVDNGDSADDGDAAGRCACPVAGRPRRTDAYTPTDKQRAFVTTRDQRCRFPNCGQRAGWTELDHDHAHGDAVATDCANLCCLCRSHHRLMTFAPGWRFGMDDDGTLQVTTPSGVTRTTRPPGLRPPGLEAPPGLAPVMPLLGQRPLAEPPPTPRRPPPDDPPPF